jgi:hypothetical protein
MQWSFAFLISAPLVRKTYKYLPRSPGYQGGMGDFADTLSAFAFSGFPPGIKTGHKREEHDAGEDDEAACVAHSIEASHGPVCQAEEAAQFEERRVEQDFPGQNLGPSRRAKALKIRPNLA